MITDLLGSDWDARSEYVDSPMISKPLDSSFLWKGLFSIFSD